MILFRSNGKSLRVYELGPLLMRVSARELPVKENGWHILENDDALARVRAMIDSGLYDVYVSKNRGDI